jgi:hypothetical protein
VGKAVRNSIETVRNSIERLLKKSLELTDFCVCLAGDHRERSSVIPSVVRILKLLEEYILTVLPTGDHYYISLDAARDIQLTMGNNHISSGVFELAGLFSRLVHRHLPRFGHFFDVLQKGKVAGRLWWCSPVAADMCIADVQVW